MISKRYEATELSIGQQRIAVVPMNYHPLDMRDVRPEWTDSLVWSPDSVTRVRHDYRQPETVAEAGPFMLVRPSPNCGKRYRQGV